MSKFNKILFTCLILLFSQTLFCKIIHVPQDQPTIQEGMNIANSGDTVLVSPGIYYENIQFDTTDIVVASLFLTMVDTAYISNTIIDGGNSETVVSFGPTTTTTTQLVGFTIQNGFGDGGYSKWKGGGINIDYYSSPQIRFCIIRENKCSYYGSGAVCWAASKPVFENCIFIENRGSRDASIYLNSGFNPYGYTTFRNCLIVENDGGIRGNSANFNILNSTISQNSYYGMYLLDNSYAYIENSIIWDNDKYNILFFEHYNPDTVDVFYSAVPSDSNSIVTNENGLVNFVEGNIENDPLFVDMDNNNFRLQKTSPSINTGNPDTTGIGLPELDLDLNPRIAGDRIDMGVYEFQTGTKVSALGSNIVDFKLINYPNPFNPSTTIQYSVPSGHVRLVVYNILGQKMKTLVDKEMSSGSYNVSWDGINDIGTNVSSGIYICIINTQAGVKTKKMLLQK